MLFLPEMPAELQGRVLPATYDGLVVPMNELLEKQSDRHLLLRGGECVCCTVIGLINLAVNLSIRADSGTTSNTTRLLMLFLFVGLLVFYFLFIFFFLCNEETSREEQR